MLNEDCLFCKIIKGEIPSAKVYEDKKVLVFNDINPVAPVHILIIPKEHIISTNNITRENSEYMATIYEKIPEIAEKVGVKNTGYRLICNCGEDAMQEIKHLHFHLVGGKKLGANII